MGTNWVKVNLPEQVIVEVDLLLKPNGYPSRSALVTDATRRWIEELQRKLKEQEDLTSEEVERLYSWALNMKLHGAEETDIRRMLLENQHLKDWAGIISKLPNAVEFVLNLKK